MLKFRAEVSDKLTMEKKSRTFLPEYLDFLRPNKASEGSTRLAMVNHLEKSNIDYNELVIKDYIRMYGEELDIFYKIIKENPRLPFTYSFRKYQMSHKKVG